MGDNRTKELNRLLQTLPAEQEKVVTDLFESGQKTGYATVDRPWDCYYGTIKKNAMFLNTTPYQGLLENNKKPFGRGGNRILWYTDRLWGIREKRLKQWQSP